jgi:hypothetical protein
MRALWRRDHGTPERRTQLSGWIAGPVASLRIDGPTVAAGGASRLGNVLHHITLE